MIICIIQIEQEFLENQRQLQLMLPLIETWSVDETTSLSSLYQVTCGFGKPWTSQKISMSLPTK
jgi:hypothetical protein